MNVRDQILNRYTINKLNVKINNHTYIRLIDAQKALKELEEMTVPKPANGTVITKNDERIEVIKKSVCYEYGIPESNLYERCRKRETHSAPRQVAMYFAKQYTTLSHAEIAFQLGRKDHATALHAIKTIKNYIETDKHFSNIIETIKKEIEDVIYILSGCGMQSDTKQKHSEALPLGESMTYEAQPIASGVGG